MTVAFLSHDAFWEHDTGPSHPERADRLTAVRTALEESGILADLEAVAPREATLDELRRVHHGVVLDALDRVATAEGLVRLDPDTPAVPASAGAARLAAGAGLRAVEELDAGRADTAFCAVRPPGHHATPDRIMGFCLLNNVAVTAATLAARGERVLVVDFDAHHGNGTEAVFWTSPEVLFVSLHQYPQYPGTGPIDAVGAEDGTGYTVNVPFPAGSGARAYRGALERVVVPSAARFEPDWLLVSAGFDAHRADPLTDLGLTAADFGQMTARLRDLVPTGRLIAFLEGGYDLDALAGSTVAALTALMGDSSDLDDWSDGSIGIDVVDDVARRHGLVG